LEELMKRFLLTITCITLIVSVNGCKQVPPGQETSESKQPVIRQAETGPAEGEVKDEQKETLKEARPVSVEDDFLARLNTSLSRVAEGVKPSIVNISTTKTISVREHPFGDLFNDPFFRRFFGDDFHQFGDRREFKTSALGSGVIVTEDGYILTNNHVIKDVDEIKVILQDMREFTGKVVGTDPKSDLAIIKVDAEKLPAITMGESDSLKVGELVIAIGNPFGLGHTITMGIVSAVGRSNVGIAEYEDFIQTDAAINPGNSGGALVNVRGELVGVNTAIFSTSGGYMGIGFAIPSDMANTIMKSIIMHGKVVRGWLGVTIQNITPDLAKYFNIQQTRGALVTDILKDTPAEKVGMQRGDVITDFNGEPVSCTTDLRNMVAGTLPGEEVTVKIMRDGNEMSFTVTIGEQADTMAGLKGTYDNVLSGVHIHDLNSEIRKSLNIPKEITGVLVTNIEGDSPAAEMLRRDDIILEINRQDVRDVRTFGDIVSQIKEGEGVLLLVYRQGGYVYIALNQ
jgi:serine protease Do